MDGGVSDVLLTIVPRETRHVLPGDHKLSHVSIDTKDRSQAARMLLYLKHTHCENTTNLVCGVLNNETSFPHFRLLSSSTSRTTCHTSL